MANDSSAKASLRTAARSRLEAHHPKRTENSTRIWNRLAELDAFNFAGKHEALMCYVGFRNEVETAQFFFRLPGSSIIVPFCDGNDIVPFRLRSLDELEPGYRGIPEPKASLRREPGRIVAPEDIELAIVPGLAFDTSGNRLGRGGGFYDRFLLKLPPTATVVGLAFDCQVFESIPVEPHDRPVDFLITETALFAHLSPCRSIDEISGVGIDKSSTNRQQ